MRDFIPLLHGNMSYIPDTFHLLVCSVSTWQFNHILTPQGCHGWQNIYNQSVPNRALCTWLPCLWALQQAVHKKDLQMKGSACGYHQQQNAGFFTSIKYNLPLVLLSEKKYILERKYIEQISLIRDSNGVTWSSRRT